MSTKLITFKEQSEVSNLIPVHINKMRCENYFWHWSSNHGDWIRTEEIPQDLKRAYKNPLLRSSYK